MIDSLYVENSGQERESHYVHNFEIYENTSWQAGLGSIMFLFSIKITISIPKRLNRENISLVLNYNSNNNYNWRNW